MLLSSSHRKLFSAILWLVLFSYMFCLPGAAIPSADWMSRVAFDKWIHIGIFTGLAFLWSRALHLVNRRSLLLLLLILLIYGLLVEVIQDQFVPHRSFDWMDWLADFAGSVLGLIIWWRYIKK